MNFHLEFPIQPFSKKLQYKEPLVFIGSCFAENIAVLMKSYKFNTLLNPHGILYNPESIATAIHRYIQNKKLTQQELFYASGAYHSWEHHSRFSNTDAVACISAINEQIETAHATLKEAGWLFITFGSAYAYKLKETGTRVGNCHKQPIRGFEKELLTIAEQYKTYRELIAVLLQFNPQLKIVFTLSPVRYLRDGLVENNRSKARLLEVIHQLTNKEQVFYFPAYELIIDDLRDYRFFKDDLVHPNDQAIKYIFGKFITALADQQTLVTFEKVKDIIKAKAHRALHDDSIAHQQFRKNYFNRCNLLQQEYPFLSLDEELHYFSA